MADEETTEGVDKSVIDKWMQIVRAAWESDSFKKMLLDNPVGVLQAAGMDPGVANVQIHEDTATTRHFVLPAKPGDVGVDEAHQSLMSDANPGF
ncbi:MAG: hypothetical protein KC549_12755 [Myxococcales bacterium]|nr:hypothetical protein [Myxococcales bacterium]MCB9544470.1 hypothetical protein [Myxococcales bacterium]